MMNLAEYRRSTSRLADFLPWAALVDEGVVLNKDGSFQRTARFRGPDLDSAVPAELVAVAGRLNNACAGSVPAGRSLSRRSVIRPAAIPSAAFPTRPRRWSMRSARPQFEEEGAHFESRYFLTFLYLPPAEDAARAERLLYEGAIARRTPTAREILRGFVDRTDRVLQLVEGFMPEAGWLDDAETLTYLHSCISTNRQRVRVPETPMHLDALLADEPLTGGLEPRLGGAHLRVLTVVGFPSATRPGLLDELNRLAFAYRWSTRAICSTRPMPPRLLTRIRRQWFAKRKSIAAILKEVMTNEASALVDTDAAQQGARCRRGAAGAGRRSDRRGLCHRDRHGLGRGSRHRRRSCAWSRRSSRAATSPACARRVNAVEAWLGSLPGHVYANVRQPPVSTLNLAHMMPLSAVWAGPATATSIQGAAAVLCPDRGSTPFRFSLHVGDVGHTLVVGPTGAGKWVLLALMALQFRRYRGAQVFAFDFGGSIRAAALAMGGDWHDLGGRLSEERRSLSPCSRWRGSTMPASAPGPRNGWRRSWPARRSASPRK